MAIFENETEKTIMTKSPSSPQKNADVVPPKIFDLISMDVVAADDLKTTSDGFCAVAKSISDILAAKAIRDFPDEDGGRLLCDRFFDDWYIYAIKALGGYTYGLFKMREQETDAADGSLADGDTPGVTVSFVEYRIDTLISCIESPTDDRLSMMSDEINRVVAYKNQRHHESLKRYFKNPRTNGSYLIADMYATWIASTATDGQIEVPLHYAKIYQRSISYKKNKKHQRIPFFIELLNAESGRTVCDHERIYVEDKKNPSDAEKAAILATHTGNLSVYSFAAEVEYHARFLTPLARIPLPFFGRSIYSSAVRADMTIDDNEFEGPAPFYRNDSAIVKRQREYHR